MKAVLFLIFFIFFHLTSQNLLNQENQIKSSHRYSFSFTQLNSELNFKQDNDLVDSLIYITKSKLEKYENLLKNKTDECADTKKVLDDIFLMNQQRSSNNINLGYAAIDQIKNSNKSLVRNTNILNRSKEEYENCVLVLTSKDQFESINSILSEFEIKLKDINDQIMLTKKGIFLKEELIKIIVSLKYYFENKLQTIFDKYKEHTKYSIVLDTINSNINELKDNFADELSLIKSIIEEIKLKSAQMYERYNYDEKRRQNYADNIVETQRMITDIQNNHIPLFSQIIRKNTVNLKTTDKFIQSSVDLDQSLTNYCKTEMNKIKKIIED